MTYEDTIRNSLVEKYADFNQLKESMFKTIMDEFSTRREKENGQLDATMQAALNNVINKLQNKYQKGDEIWLWIDNPDQPFAETWGYAIIRNGEPTAWEILGRR